MNEDDICLSSLVEIAERIRTGEVSPVELTNDLLSRIDRVASKLNCYITILHDEARRRAEQMEHLLSQGIYIGPLHGVPVSLKDNIVTAGIRTTAGSPILATWVPDANATVVDRLLAAGAVIIAKANLYEFAYSASHPQFGIPRNPWNLDRSCGGSSNGSAAAVASGLCYASIATDTGGSIRSPAALCGVVAIRPTYGLVSRAGVIPLSYTLDSVGPMTRSVRDAALVLQAIAGYDPADRSTVRRPVPDYLNCIEDVLDGMRMGIVKPQVHGRVHPEVQRAISEATIVFEKEGVEVIEVDLPDYRQARVVWRTISAAEASEFHRSYLRTRAKDYHPSVRTWLEVGEFIPATEYIHAQRTRQYLIGELRSIFEKVDVLAVPAYPAPAYPIDATSLQFDGHEEDLREVTHGSPLISLTGRPAMVMPCGFSSEGLPIGIQIVGRPYREDDLLRVARGYERATDWHFRRPRV